MPGAIFDRSAGFLNSAAACRAAPSCGEQATIVLVLNLIIGFSSGFIDNWGHHRRPRGVLITFSIMPLSPAGSGAARPAAARVVDHCRVLERLDGVVPAAAGVGVYVTTVVRWRLPAELDQIHLLRVLLAGRTQMDNVRRSGILLHPTSLPGLRHQQLQWRRHTWVDFLAHATDAVAGAAARLPAMTARSGFSSFAGNPYLTQPGDAGTDGAARPGGARQCAARERACRRSVIYLQTAAAAGPKAGFAGRATPELRAEFDAFARQEMPTACDDSHSFMALRARTTVRRGDQWEMDLRSRKRLSARREEHAADRARPQGQPVALLSPVAPNSRAT